MKANSKYIFCQYCPCVWCDKNEEQNEKITGYSFIPDPDHCKKMFKKEKEISYDLFLKAVFQLHGSSINTDWKRFLDGEDNSGNK